MCSWGWWLNHMFSELWRHQEIVTSLLLSYFESTTINNANESDFKVISHSESHSRDTAWTAAQNGKTDLKNNFHLSLATKLNSSVVTGVWQLVPCCVINKCFYLNVPTWTTLGGSLSKILAAEPNVKTYENTF